MSKETQKWLDEMIKVGFTAPEYGRGDAWHRRKGNLNSYKHAVPFGDAFDLIASWTPVKVSPMWHNPETDEYEPLEDYHGSRPTALIHSQNHKLLGMHSEKYADHGYEFRLFTALSRILDTSTDDMGIGSCGLLDGYKKAWVQLELPETIEGPAGDNYRPFITATSSLDGSIPTTYLKGVTRVVCDNTLSLALGTSTNQFRIRNTLNSQLKIEDARQALDLIFKVGEDYTAQVNDLLAIKITEKDWKKFIDAYVPIPEEGKKGLAERKRESLEDLYHNDNMVAPWKGTAWGVQQAVNTYYEHLSIVRKTNRIERSQMNFLTGATTKNDTEALRVLASVLPGVPASVVG